jgi:IrrE N-terminal-like domain
MSIRQHAGRLVAALQAELIATIADSPIEGARRLGLTVQAVDTLADDRGAHGWCDGVSFLRAGTILYVRSPNSRREHFTIAHEIAHWLVDRDDEAVDWLADLPDAPRTLEQLCDQIAGRLLVTDDALDALLAGRTVEATDVRALYESTTASEPVCAIALTRRLHVPGALVLLDRGTQTVSYASLIWDFDDERPIAYPWPGQQIPVGHPLRGLAAGSRCQRRSWWATPWDERHTYYLDAVSGQNRIAAVFAETDLWGCEKLHLDTPSRRPSKPSFTLSCQCGFVGEVRSYPHDDCGQPFCPRCEECACVRKYSGHKACKQCFVSTPPRDLVDGLCSMCR